MLNQQTIQQTLWLITLPNCYTTFGTNSENLPLTAGICVGRNIEFHQLGGNYPFENRF